MTLKEKIAVVFPSYNAKEFLDQCLSPLSTMDCQVDEIIVVDDCSSDGTAEYLHENYPQVRVISLSVNSGASKACNIGIAATDARYVYIIEHHTVVIKDSLSQLMQVMTSDPKAAICYSKQLNVYSKQKIIVEGARNAHYVVNQHCEHQMLDDISLEQQEQEKLIQQLKEQSDKTPRDVSSAGAVSFLIDREKLGTIGYFDETYFIYLNDHEFALRVKAAGLKCYYVPTSIVYHKSLVEKINEFNFRGGGKYPALRTYYISRHRWLIIFTHYSFKSILLLSPALAIYEIFLFAFVFSRGVLKPYLKSIVWLVTHPKLLLEKRRKIQSLKCVKDSSLLVAGELNFVPGLAQSRFEHRMINGLTCFLTGFWALVKKWI